MHKTYPSGYPRFDDLNVYMNESINYIGRAIISKCPKRAHRIFAWLIFDSNVPYLQFHSLLCRQFVLWLLFLECDNCKKDVKIGQNLLKLRGDDYLLKWLMGFYIFVFLIICVWCAVYWISFNSTKQKKKYCRQKKLFNIRKCFQFYYRGYLLPSISEPFRWIFPGNGAR